MAQTLELLVADCSIVVKWRITAEDYADKDYMLQRTFKFRSRWSLQKARPPSRKVFPLMESYEIRKPGT